MNISEEDFARVAAGAGMSYWQPIMCASMPTVLDAARMCHDRRCAASFDAGNADCVKQPPV